jgi:hypothetical protein
MQEAILQFNDTYLFKLKQHARVKTSHCLKITELMYAQFWIFSHLLLFPKILQLMNGKLIE